MRPFIILIAGGSGTGKSTVAELLAKMGSYKASFISFDNFYKDRSGIEQCVRDQINYDEPEAFDVELLLNCMDQLINCQDVEIPIYDFETHCRSHENKKIEKCEVLLVEGIFALYFKSVRDRADLKVFLDVDADERLIRRLTRDIIERDRTVESVVDQYRCTVKPMYEKYVNPTKQYADIILNEINSKLMADKIYKEICERLYKINE